MVDIFITSSFTGSASPGHLRTSVLIALIIGPVLGVVLLLLLGFILFRKRRAKREHHKLDMTEDFAEFLPNMLVELFPPASWPGSSQQWDESSGINTVQRTPQGGVHHVETSPDLDPGSFDWSSSRAEVASLESPADSRVASQRPVLDRKSARVGSTSSNSVHADVQAMRMEISQPLQMVGQGEVAPPPDYASATGGTDR
jgi:hypothetical protein